MKTIKQSMLLLAASFAATISFAQVGLGVANSTRATTKAVNVNATTRVAANAATRTTNATKATVSTTTATAAQAKNTLKQNANANARINAQADVHASEQARLHANENAAVFGTQTNADVTVDGAAAADKVEQKVVKTKDKVNAEKDATVKTTKKVKAKTEMGVKAEAQATEHASEEALKHANDHSAVFGATSETQAGADVKTDRKDVSADGKVKTNTKAKGQVKKG